MEDFSNDDINYFIAKLSEDCSKSFFDNYQDDSQLLGMRLDEQLIKYIRDKEEMMKTMFDLLNYIFKKQQKILADYEDLKIQGEHNLLVLKQEIQQNQYQIEQLQTLNEENQEKNQQFLDQIEELENQLQQKKSEILQIKKNEGRISQNHQVFQSKLIQKVHEIKFQEQKEQLQSLQAKVQQLEKNNSRFKSEAIASFNLLRQYEMKQKDYEDKIEILELQLKSNQREKEILSKQYEELFKNQQSEIITSTQIDITNNFTHNSPQKSTRKNSNYSTYNDHQTIKRLRGQGGYQNQPKLEQIQKQINNIPESESESEDDNQLNSGKTLKQEKNEKKNIQKELNNLKIKIEELEKQKAEMEKELSQNKEMISNQDTKIRQLETNQKKMNLKSNQLEKKVINLTEGKLNYYFQRKMPQKILTSKKNHQNKINQRNRVKIL
ncbi:unnamed protein product (macronuclear) [Paramecium tetraurelia]|uniref:Uncharacterized protein n=1 Tax=Paramecium tetraurelia TaxID=5888 RepID=A0E434_PARTE|nr:uncharacterized protein GSPATT00023224001 [Paramecium tetraurelia]CAK90051.1 unnamed protein product [Paramecium tetraurelia]|eukprot:XP_001457448.1 hypothetical protein (macronuclear) [Paramecium tetraurelia strain d4-2]